MMSIKLKIGLVLGLFILLSFVFVSPVSADGMGYVYKPDRRDWELWKEEQQLCAINYEDGFENMILSVSVSDLHGEKAVWIFPVPAKPDKIVIDIIKEFPRVGGGYDVKEEADRKISDTFTIMRLSQVYTIPYTILATLLDTFSRASIGSSIGGGEGGIVIHEHIEKMGLTTELITAEDGNAFYNYLTNKGLELPVNSKSILNEYIGKEYSFVVSWISDIEKFKQKSAIIGVSITFPTDKIYFPLKPTSVYGSQQIPILIYVIGYVTPEVYPEIKNAQINYYVLGYLPNELSSSFSNWKRRIGNLKYTKIKINVPSKYLTEDLWIKDSAPIDIVLADFINRSTWILGIVLFILSSCLASMFAGMVVFRKDQPDKKKFALFGLWNFFTLIGFAIASIFFRTKNIVIWDDRKILFVFLFSIFFLIMTFVFQIILQSIF